MNLNLTRSMALLLVMLCGSMISASAQTSAPPPLLVVKDAVVPTLETNHSRYAVGDPILMKTALKNVTGMDYEVLITHYPAAVHVTLKDSSGTIVHPQNHPQFFMKSPGTSMSAFLPLKHGQTMVVAWGYVDQQQWIEQEWVDLSTFGYEQIPPGRYTLTVVVRAGLRAEYPGKTPETPISGQDSVTVDESGNGTTASATFTVDPPSHL
jgi:hypothetical protein